MLNDDGLHAYLTKLPAAVPFTSATARTEGVPAHALHQLVRAGMLRHPVQSVYVPNGVSDTLSNRVEILELILPEGCFVTDHTAAWLHAGDSVLLPNADLAPGRPDVFRHSQLRALRNPIVRSGERMVRRDDLMTIGNVAVTTPLRTAVDIGRLFTRDVALWGLDSMLATGSFSHDELVSIVPRLARQRGVVQLRVLAAIADGGSASFGESALRLRWYDAGLPRPELQVAVDMVGRTTYWLDMGLTSKKFAAEYDGEAWHSSPEASAHDAARRAMLAEEGWVVLVFRARDVFGRLQTADLRLRAAYAEVKLRPFGGEVAPARR